MSWKVIYRLSAIVLPPAVLAWSRVDAVFSASMPRKALAEPLLLLLCGWLVSALCPWPRRPSHAPAAIVAAVVLILFWMIPRSIDLTQIEPGVNALYVISLFAAGLLLSAYFPFLPGVAKVVCLLYLSSMLVAFGLVYASLTTLLCSTFSLEDQHAFGRLLVALGLASYSVVLASVTRWLVPPSRRS